MKCPFCATLDSKVIDSRPANDGTSIRRRRQCLKCKNRFTTYETVEMLPLVVIKKSGARQAFDRGKLLGSMLKACEKRSVSLSLLERAADEIEQELQNELGGEVSSTRIGELVMERLRDLDEVLAQVREKGETPLLLMLDEKGIRCSSGSACTSESLDPSHVLIGMGVPVEAAHGSLRFSLNEENTEEEVDYIIEQVHEVVNYLRSISPFWEELEKGEREHVIQ